MTNRTFVIVAAGWGAVSSVWSVLLVAQHLARHRGLMVRPLPALAEIRSPLPAVAVIVPARNEEAAIDGCLRRVLEQDYPALEVLLIDDRSEDATVAIAQRLAQSDPRLSIHRIDQLPSGWLAKSHALWSGSQTIEAEWLLFIDADCAMHPAAVRTAVAEAGMRSADGLTLWPRNAAVTFWEHLLIPLCAGIIALWYGTAEAARAPRRPAFANGQFLLIRRSAYLRMGGHSVVRRAIIEDIALAEQARAEGIHIHVASGRDLVDVRMYQNLPQIIDGWSRIYVGALRSGWKIILSVLWLLVGSLLPYIAAPFLTFAVIFAQPTTRGIVLLALCAQHLILIHFVSHRFWGMGGCRRRYLWLYPVSVLGVILILCKSLWLLTIRRRIQWRHTSYAIGARGTIVG